MEKKIWFRAKRYGLGWFPVTWEGWLVVIVFVLFQVWNFVRIDSTSHSNSDTVRPFIIQLIISLVVLFVFCLWKGEKLKWKWGDRN